MVYLPTVHVHLVDFYGTPRETYQSHGSYEKGKSFSSYCFKGKVLVSGSVTATSNLIRKSKQNNFNLLHLQGLESESPGYPASRIYKGENYYASSKSVPGFSSDIITHRMHGTGILYLPTNLPSKNAPSLWYTISHVPSKEINHSKFGIYTTVTATLGSSWGVLAIPLALWRLQATVDLLQLLSKCCDGEENRSPDVRRRSGRSCIMGGSL